MAHRPTLIQLDPHQVEALDLIARDEACSRSHLVREAIKDLLDKRRNRTIAEQYREGYGRHPQEDDPWLDEMNDSVWKDLPW